MFFPIEAHTMALALPYSLTLLLLVLSVPYSTTAQTPSYIDLGSSLIAADHDSYWASPSGDFAFGFQEIVKGGYLLAIWFNKIHEKTIVWSTNGNNLAPKESIVKFTADGQFVLYDTTGKEIWKADLVGSGAVASAAILDNGNFVLANQSSAYLWQRFNHPTDTILPTNIMNMGGKLVARYAETNYSDGRFQFTLQPDGNLVLYTRAFPLNSANAPYWSSETEGTGSQVVFNQSGSVYLTTIKNNMLYTISPASPAGSSGDFYQRVILEYDGVFRHYVYPKSNGSKGWHPLPSFITSTICNAVIEETGSGACGFNSYCRLEVFDQRPHCNRPEGYTFIDQDDVMKECKKTFVSQSCDAAFPETDAFDFLSMRNTDWPGSDYEYFHGQTEGWCRAACLGDCLCAAAIYQNGTCWKKRTPLSNGRTDSTVQTTTLIKIRKDNSTLKPPGVDSENKDSSSLKPPGKKDRSSLKASVVDSEKKDVSTLILIGSMLLFSSVSLNFL